MESKEIKEIADTIMYLFKMDGYSCTEPPLYENKSHYKNTHVELIVSIGGNYEPLMMFRKTPFFSFGAQEQPLHMIVNVIDGVIIIVYENTVYGVKNKEIKFIEEIE